MFKKYLVLGLSFLVSIPSFAAGPSFKHVVVIIFENASYESVLKEKFFSDVANQGVLFTQFIAEAHPSQPNYVALVSGDTLGVRSDANVNLNSTHVGNLLEKANLDWRVYAENLPSPCFLGASQGRYARKHVPFISFLNVQQDPKECAKIVDGSQFQSDLTSNKLPAFSLYIPNLDNDGHDTGVSYASQWFAGAFGNIFKQPDLLKDTLFMITFDESDHYLAKNQVYTVFLGANILSGSRVQTVTTHYSVLSTIEANFNLGSLGRKDGSTSPVSGIWK